MDPARLDPTQRASDLERVQAQTFDLVVIGGGVVGAGTALDAATRGLSVALIEQRDWAAGTSSRSSKLIHGGLRYLEQLDFGLVREALGEQTLMLERLCPASRAPRPLPLPAHASRLGARLYRRRHAALRRARRPASATPPSPPHPTRRAVAFPGSARRPHGRGNPVLGCAGRRRAAHAGTIVRTARVHGAATLSSVRAEDFMMSRRAGLGRAGPLPRDRATARDRGASGRQRDRRLDRLRAGTRRTRPRPRARLEGHPSGRAARSDPWRRRPDPSHGEERALRDSLG